MHLSTTGCPHSGEDKSDVCLGRILRWMEGQIFFHFHLSFFPLSLFFHFHLCYTFTFLPHSLSLFWRRKIQRPSWKEFKMDGRADFSSTFNFLPLSLVFHFHFPFSGEDKSNVRLGRTLRWMEGQIFLLTLTRLTGHYLDKPARLRFKVN